MKENRVFSGETVEEAVAAGLAELGLAREQVKVEVLAEGSRGLLGIGARAARVRLIPLAGGEQAASRPHEPAAPVREPATTLDHEESGPVDRPTHEGVEPTEIAHATLATLLERMGIAAEIRIHPPVPAEGQPLVLDVRGTEADALIGPKGETLASLQHIVRLMVNQQLGGQSDLVVDVNGHKQRQAVTLQRLAERMAEQAVRSRRRVVLEPMPAYERRIIHLALQHRDDVRTESEGVGRQRRVTIIPRP